MARVLVIDDEPDIRNLLRNLLEEAGHTVDDAPNGEDGLRRASQNDYAVVICDLLMPVKEGIETIIELRRTYPSVKIMALSGGGSRLPAGFLDYAGALGADRAMAKPFDLDEVGRAIQELLQQQAA
jgi:CheY-like chemotaxis protein